MSHVPSGGLVVASSRLRQEGRDVGQWARRPEWHQDHGWVSPGSRCPWGCPLVPLGFPAVLSPLPFSESWFQMHKAPWSNCGRCCYSSVSPITSRIAYRRNTCSNVKQSRSVKNKRQGPRSAQVTAAGGLVRSVGILPAHTTLTEFLFQTWDHPTFPVVRILQ